VNLELPVGGAQIRAMEDHRAEKRKVLGIADDFQHVRALPMARLQAERRGSPKRVRPGDPGCSLSVAGDSDDRKVYRWTSGRSAGLGATVVRSVWSPRLASRRITLPAAASLVHAGQVLIGDGRRIRDRMLLLQTGDDPILAIEKRYGDWCPARRAAGTCPRRARAELVIATPDPDGGAHGPTPGGASGSGHSRRVRLLRVRLVGGVRGCRPWEPAGSGVSTSVGFPRREYRRNLVVRVGNLRCTVQSRFCRSWAAIRS